MEPKAGSETSPVLRFPSIQELVGGRWEYLGAAQYLCSQTGYLPRAGSLLGELPRSLNRYLTSECRKGILELQAGVEGRNTHERCFHPGQVEKKKECGAGIKALPCISLHLSHLTAGAKKAIAIPRPQPSPWSVLQPAARVRCYPEPPWTVSRPARTHNPNPRRLRGLGAGKLRSRGNQ